MMDFNYQCVIEYDGIAYVNNSKVFYSIKPFKSGKTRFEI